MSCLAGVLVDRTSELTNERAAPGAKMSHRVIDYEVDDC